MIKRLELLFATIGITLCLQGCEPGQQSFLSIQVCAFDQHGVIRLKSIMRAVALSEHLEFIDNSAQQASDLKTMGADKALKRDANHAIDFHIEGENGLGVTAGNLGLPPYQIALGFTEGTDATRAHRLSDRMVRALSPQWHVETVPQRKGVLPMKSCGG